MTTLLTTEKTKTERGTSVKLLYPTCETTVKTFESYGIY